MKTKNWMYGLLVAGVMMAAACGGNQQPTGRELLSANEWALTEIVTPDSTTTQMPVNGAWIAFSDSTRVGGYAGCNAFFGTFETTAENGISFSQFGRTMMFCTDMEIENLFLATFEKMTSFLVEEGRLELTDGGGSKLSFDVRSAPQP